MSSDPDYKRIKLLVKFTNKLIHDNQRNFKDKHPNVALIDDPLTEEIERCFISATNNKSYIESKNETPDSYISLASTDGMSSGLAYDADNSDGSNAACHSYSFRKYFHSRVSSEKNFADDSKSVAGFTLNDSECILLEEVKNQYRQDTNAWKNDPDEKTNNETSSGVHSDISLYNNSNDDDSDLSTSQFVVPIFGDSSDACSCPSEASFNVNWYNDRAKNSKLLAYDRQSQLSLSSINDSQEDIGGTKKSYLWLNSCSHNCSCSHCGNTRSTDTTSDYYHRCSSPTSASFAQESRCHRFQSTPRHKYKNESLGSRSSDLCDNCIKTRGKKLRQMFHDKS